ncbi:MAG TPA: hypothetical protein VFU00_05825, partial [Gemmatimonadales bacterium]|nr:hypothetical protein [Gemmatimonadales bacterium]
MSFRARLLIALLAAALLPLAALAIAVRREMARVVATEQDARTAEAVAAIGTGLHEDRVRTAGRLRSLKGELAEDSRFRLAVSVGDARARAWLLDYAGSAMRAAGLDFLQIQDAAGRVLSSGHFRNEYDRALPTPGGATGAGSLFLVRTPTGTFLALGTSDSFTTGGATYTIAGGTALDSVRLAGLSRAPGIEVLIILPGE